MKKGDLRHSESDVTCLKLINFTSEIPVPKSDYDRNSLRKLTSVEVRKYMDQPLSGFGDFGINYIAAKN